MEASNPRSVSPQLRAATPTFAIGDTPATRRGGGLSGNPTFTEEVSKPTGTSMFEGRKGLKEERL
jgi:hypothetical protein